MRNRPRDIGPRASAPCNGDTACNGDGVLVATDAPGHRPSGSDVALRCQLGTLCPTLVAGAAFGWRPLLVHSEQGRVASEGI